MYGTLANTGVTSAGLAGTAFAGIWAGLLVATMLLALVAVVRLVPRKLS
jgi:tetrahydromethanopterin S-methyltransferase subunit B